jgi:hypothetical protein
MAFVISPAVSVAIQSPGLTAGDLTNAILLLAPP